MRLALIHKQMGGGGGLENYLVNFARHLVEAGHHLEIVTQRVVEPALGSGHVRIHQLGEFPFSRALRLLEYNRQASRMAAELDVDFVLGFGRTVAQDVHRAGGGCHRIYSRYLPPWKRYSVKNLVELDLERQLYTGGRTRHFVVNASPVADDLAREYAIERERLSVIHTPVDHSRFHPGTVPKAEVCPDSSGTKPVFLFVSLNHKRKGLDVLLELWDQVDAELWIVGRPLATSHENAIRSRNLGGRVFYLGRRNDLPRIYQAADFFIHPTRYDACANTVLQAMASGLTSLVSCQDGAREFIENGETGFLLEDPADPGLVLGQIQRALSLSMNDRARMGTHAQERVSRHTWENHLAAWMNLLTRLSESGPGSLGQLKE